jgi:competence protein ComEA
MQTRTPTRAAEVLEALAREQTRKPLYRRARTDAASPFAPPGQSSDAQSQPASAQQDQPNRMSGDPSHMTQPRWGRERMPQRMPQWMPLWVQEQVRQVDLRKLAAVFSVLALVALGLGWTSLRRPASLDDRLPIASSSSTAQAAPAAEVANPAEAGAKPAAVGQPAATGPVFVHVAGAVLSAGVVQLPNGSRVVDAVAAAGGLRPDADSNRVNLAATLLDGSQVMIPTLGQLNPEQVPVVQGGASGSSAGGSTAAGSAGSGSGAGEVAGPVNLNTATLEQFESLPGVGPATAQAIIAFRDKEGRFNSIEALLDVRGIGDAKFEALRELVTV